MVLPADEFGTLELELPSQGLFDRPAREQAIADTLPLLATYFVAGQAWELRPQAGLLSAEEEEEEVNRDLAQAVRLRVLLALGHELEEIVHRIIDQPSFQYRRRRDESAGVIAGRLDVPRHLRGAGRLTAPVRYPITVVERQLATPENVLASAAVHSVLNGLNSAPLHLLPPKEGPERRALRDLRASLARVAQLPIMAALREEGERVARQGRLSRQRDRVMRRLSRRDIPHPDPYRDLTEWVESFVSGTAPKPGSALWSFYDERFDFRLFEIWCLAQAAEALTQRFGEPEEELRPLWQRGDEPRAAWSTPYGHIEIFFRRDASGLGMTPNWALRSRQHALGAFPDVTIRVMTPDRPQWVLLDAKLRRHAPLPAKPSDRLDLPSEEIYKVLGYFEHLSRGPYATGGLIYYTPGAAGSAILHRGPAEQPPTGSLLLAGVDPSRSSESRAAMAHIAELVGARLGEPSPSAVEEAEQVANEAAQAGADVLEVAAARKARLFREVAASFAERHPRQREVVESTTRSSYRVQDWESFDSETQRMLISSEMYAIHQPREMDFSGPLLVLCAACERELNRRFFGPLSAAHAEEESSEGRPLLSAHPTLGQAVYMLRHGVGILSARRRTQDERVQRILDEAESADDARAWELTAQHLEERGCDVADAARLVDRLASLNKRYRRPAAHDKPVEAESWVLGRGLVLGPDQVLSEIASVFPALEKEPLGDSGDSDKG